MKPLKNVAASIHQRLLNLARKSGRPFSELAQYYALERWLYRLAQSDCRNQFILKGALMLLAWKVPVTRPTRDIDLLGCASNDLASIHQIITMICQIPAGDDGMFFDPKTVAIERIAEDAAYGGVRTTFQASLGNTRMPMQVDIGFSDVITPGPVTIVYPSILGHPAAELQAYNRETVIAEKFEAMVKLGELNSRMKDFFDIWILAKTGQFQRSELSAAIEQTFSQRGSTLIVDPICFTEAFAMNPAKVIQWTSFLRRNKFAEVIEPFADVIKIITEFIQPVVSASKAKRPLIEIWEAGGPWKGNG